MDTTISDHLTGDAQAIMRVLISRALLYRRQEPDAMRAEDLAQDAGIAEVGSPDTRMAHALKIMHDLSDMGYVEPVKLDEQRGYKLSRIGERAMLLERAEHAELAQKAVEESALALAERVRALDRSIDQAHLLVMAWEEWGSLPWFKRMWREKPGG